MQRIDESSSKKGVACWTPQETRFETGEPQSLFHALPRSVQPRDLIPPLHPRRMQELYFSALVSKGLGQSDEAAETEDRRGGAPEEKNVRTRVACRRFVVAVEAALHKRAGGRSGDSLEYRRSARHVLSLLRREATSLAAAVIAGELKPKALILRACSKE